MVLKFYVEVEKIIKEYLFRGKCSEGKLGWFEGTNTIEKTSGSQKKTLIGKGTPEECQEAAVIENGATESGVQPPKVPAFPPGFSVSEEQTVVTLNVHMVETAAAEGRKSWQIRKKKRGNYLFFLY